MGWSCRLEASKVAEAWTNACVVQTGSQNTFKVGTKTYFWETSRTEHSDGSITGAIWKFVAENKCRKVGTFRIEGNGTIARAPKFLVEAKEDYGRERNRENEEVVGR